MNDEWDIHRRTTTRTTTDGMPLSEPPTTLPVMTEPVIGEPVSTEAAMSQPVASEFPVTEAIPVQPVQAVQPVQPVQAVQPVQPVVVPTDAAYERDVTSTRWRVSPAAVMAGASAVALMLWGAVVLARAGTDAPLDEPAVQVAGFSATAILGLIVLGGGAMLLLAAFTRSRAAIAFVAIVLGIAAAAIAIEPTWGQTALAADRDGAVAALVLLGITLGVALIAPDVERVHRRRDEWRA